MCILAKLTFYAPVPSCNIATESSEKVFVFLKKLVSLKIHATHTIYNSQVMEAT